MYTGIQSRKERQAHHSVLVVPVHNANERPPLQGVSGMGEAQQKNLVGRGTEKNWEVGEPVGDPGSIADGRRGQAVLDFLSSTNVGKLVPAADDVGSEVSEWELREHRGGKRRGGRRSWVPRRSWVRRNHCSYPLHLSWYRQKRSSGRVTLSFVERPN